MKTIKDYEDQIGIESYPLTQTGGQHAGIRKGIRLWYPKGAITPLVDIRIQTERSQWKNRNIAVAMLELIMEDL